MKNNKPLKRAKELQPYSKDHHHGLLFGWKIRTGIKKNVAPERLCAYASWFYDNHLMSHFDLEERFMFPILGMTHEMILRALDEHRQIRSLMAQKCNSDALIQLADLLEAHIRFEERTLFGEIQSVANPSQLELIDRMHTEERFVEYSDEFWK